MAFGILTVIGFAVLIAVVTYFVVYFLQTALISRDATIIDPKPDNNF
ncbi:hypothetical protein [Paenisporosarcina sp. TG20]|nr:hypothetical protein [Paenisporosarcina sp. TG20]